MKVVSLVGMTVIPICSPSAVLPLQSLLHHVRLSFALARLCCTAPKQRGESTAETIDSTSVGSTRRPPPTRTSRRRPDVFLFLFRAVIAQLVQTSSSGVRSAVENPPRLFRFKHFSLRQCCLLPELQGLPSTTTLVAQLGTCIPCLLRFRLVSTI